MGELTVSAAWRPAEIEEPTNRWVIHPLSWVLVRWCARRGVHPNAVSMAGLCCGVGAAVAYGFWQEGWTCAVGLVLMVLWHVFDGADGQLARLTGKASELGKVVDGLCDHGTFAVLYGALAWSLQTELGQAAFLLAGAAGLSHFVQAGAYERQRQLYEYVVFGKPVVEADVRRVWKPVRGLYWLYLAVQGLLSGERFLLWQLHRAGAVLSEWVQAGYRRWFRPVVHAWSVLSSNYRTLALFAACCVGMPEAFLWWEVVGLNGFLLCLVLWTRRRQQHFVEELHGNSVSRRLEPSQ